MVALENLEAAPMSGNGECSYCGSHLGRLGILHARLSIEGASLLASMLVERGIRFAITVHPNADHWRQVWCLDADDRRVDEIVRTLD